MPTLLLTGGCHCGAVRFAVLVSEQLDVLECNCSICAMTGYLHLIVEAGNFTLRQGTEMLTDYRFNSGTARHLFCSACGIKSFYVPRSHPDGYSVNLRALDVTDGVVATIQSYDGKNWDTARTGIH